MNYIILDMEWNQPAFQSASLMASLPSHAEGEIIQIGAVRLDEQGFITDKFNLDIRPKYFTKINRNVKKLTGFDQQRMMAGVTFPEGLNAFRDWCGEDAILFTWGFDDHRLFHQNAQLHSLDVSFASRWYNLQIVFNMQEGLDNQQRSLETAVQHFEIPQDLPAHDAFNDAYYTALVAAKLDLPRGIAEYPATVRKKEAQESAPELQRNIYSGIAGKPAAFKMEPLTKLYCPKCGRLLTDDFRWTSQSSSKYFMLTNCPEDGYLVAKLRFLPEKNEKVTAVKSFVAVDETTAASYQRKTEKAEARREMLRQRHAERNNKAELAE